MAPVPQRASGAQSRPSAPPAAQNLSWDPWPQGISRHATMRISDVLAALGAEFPTVSHSKLRFLEEQGLVNPVRTPAGYRQYSPADVERLRYVLRQQRDRYLPLKVIGEQLAELDAGRGTQPVTPQLASKDGERATAGAEGRETPDSLARSLDVEPAFVAGLVDAGVLATHGNGDLEEGAREVVRIAAALAEHGIDARHMRSFRQAADRQVDVVEQIAAPWRSQRAASARARAGTVAVEVGELCAQLHTAFVRGGVQRLTD
ncbi:MAG: MerR family transcriptional regulator [Actinomycetota bacterium]|nr:MerR family transcriptional regulator [Actinomycetota bacterium]